MLAILVKLIHLVVCFALIVIVLFQADKGEGLAGAFGGGASGTIFGERGAETQISKMTTYLAVVFMITSLILAVWGPDWDKESKEAQYSVQTTQSQPIQAEPSNTVPTPEANTALPTVPSVPTSEPVTSQSGYVETTAPVIPPVTTTTSNNPIHEVPAQKAVEEVPSTTIEKAAPVDQLPPQTPAAPPVSNTTIPSVNE